MVFFVTVVGLFGSLQEEYRKRLVLFIADFRQVNAGLIPAKYRCCYCYLPFFPHCNEIRGFQEKRKAFFIRRFFSFEVTQSLEIKGIA